MNTVTSEQQGAIYNITDWRKVLQQIAGNNSPWELSISIVHIFEQFVYFGVKPLYKLGIIQSINQAMLDEDCTRLEWEPPPPPAPATFN